MSCFVVGNDHINALLTWAVFERVSLWDRAQKQNIQINEDNADSFGQILADENCRSYNHRYQGENVDALDYAFRPFPVPLTPFEVIRACDCLDYQSCETDDWPETAAAQILQKLIEAAAKKAMALGLEASDVWEIRPDTLAKLQNANEKPKGKRRA